MTLGLDSSTSITGWAFSDNGQLKDAGFINTSKFKTNKEKGKFVVNFLKSHPLIGQITKINLEAALSGFGRGFTSQQTLIMLSRWNAILEYILTEEFINIPLELCNVNTARKKVLGKARLKGFKPKEYVKQRLPLIVSNITQFEKLNRDGNWDAHNADMYDAVLISLY